MRFSWMLVLVLGCTGGSNKGDDDDDDDDVTDADYIADFFDVGCEAARSCGADSLFEEAYCEPYGDYTDCTVDEDLIDDCLSGEWVCGNVEGIVTVEPPSSCVTAFDCPVTDTGSTSGDDDDDDDDDDVVFIDEFDDGTLDNGVSCSGSQVAFEFEFLGEASSGFIDSSDTVNRDVPYGAWNDTHTLDTVAISATGSTMAISVATKAGPGTWSDGVSTVFRCDYHFESPGVMSYIARAYDLSGDLSDCVAWGEAATYFIDGDDLYNARPQESDFASCRVAAAAR